MRAPSIINSLVEHFQRNRDACHSPLYNETQLRREFLDPFFEALGWDVFNKQGYSEAYKDVIHEDQIKVGEGTKAPDYCFRIGGTRKFFVEAKKPAINIREDASPAFQLRRYAWSAKLPLSILTDFEEFAVYDCRIRPHQTDKASAARLIILTYEEYLEKWEEIASIFSRDAVLKGSFDKYAESKRRRGTAEVDDAFLADIETWRKEFAQNFALRNERLSQRELNFAVERTIDRIIFLRVSEDRGIEPYSQLRDLIAGRNIYTRLFEIFRRADDRYNSGLFHFQKEMGRAEAPDELTPTLTLDDKPLKEIIQGLYYPDSPYEFSVLSADILGQVYEQFLGKVIRLTEGHRAKVEDKPEVKKAGGVYYTPTYIVDYVVKHTVGKLLEGKTPKEAAKLRILDPACGSGSFLIGAYQYLLDWHLKWCTKEADVGAQGLAPARRKAARYPIYQTTGGQWRLTPTERKRILLNNICGVDIDPQAVEVTKLSLLLKVLEGESRDSLNAQLKMFRQRALPDLGANIKCGNSLIGPDFYDHAQMELLDDEEKYRINAFDWNTEFADIMKAGGFDAVIGNPPWGANLSESELHYLRDKHSEIIVRMIDSFMYFLHANSKRLRRSGFLGMIVPDVLLYQVDNEKLRQYILASFSLRHSINMGNVFHRVTRPASIIILQNKPPAGNNTIVADLSSTDTKNKPAELERAELFSTVSQDRFLQMPGSMLTARSGTVFDLWDRIKLVPHQSLGDVVDEHGIQRGVSPDLKDAFIVLPKTVREQRLEKKYLKPTLTGGKHVKRYAIENPNLSLIYTDRDDDPREFPNIKKFVSSFKSRITCKEVIEGKHPIWSLHRARDEAIFTKRPKIIGVITGDRITVALDQDCHYVTDGLFLLGLKKSYDPRYIMAVLNSRLFVYLYRSLTAESGRVLAQVKPTLLKRLPIRSINFSDKQDKARHDKMVALVERMLKMNRQLPKAKTPDEKTRLERQIAATDKQIDNLVYELYGLTEEEIKIVEGE